MQYSQAVKEFATTQGVRKVTVLGGTTAGERSWSTQGSMRTAEVTIGDCAALREVARLPQCHDGDAFVVSDGQAGANTAQLARTGRTLYLDTSYFGVDGSPGIGWTVPANLKSAHTAADPSGQERSGFLVTPAALPADAVSSVMSTAYLSLDESLADAPEYVRNTAAKLHPLADVSMWTPAKESRKYASIRTGLSIGSACVLVLIGFSLLVSQLEQLRERRKLLSALVAFGTRRRTLSLSVLWQT
ncbi:ABC transporter permease, partial [Streptomyces sp. SID625]|nr:ABC transporter permease [Streptomyces sp. SID625]